MLSKEGIFIVHKGQVAFTEIKKAAAVSFLATSYSDYKEDVQTAWENIGDDINISAKEGLDDYERKQHKLWSDKEHSNCISKESR